MTWNDIKRELEYERGHFCENCGVSHPLDPAHHGVIWRLKGANNILDVKFNLLILCMSCHKWFHDHKQDGIRQAWALLVERYGRQAMVDWLEGLDLLVKPRIEWLEAE